MILNRTDNTFYGHNGTEWVSLSASGGGGGDNGLQATDAAG